MSDTSNTLGRRLIRATSIDTLLELEQEAGLGEHFAALDELIGNLLISSLHAHRTIELSSETEKSPSIKIIGLTTKQRTYVTKMWSLDQQQARGAWFLPDAVDVRPGLINLPYTFKMYGRFATSIAWEQNAKVPLSSSADAVLEWALLDPLLEVLMAPLILRGKQAGTKGRDDQLKRWATIDELLAALGFSLHEELAGFRYGSGWHKLNASQQHDAKLRLLEALERQANIDMGARYRAFCVRILAEQYYKKAKGGRAKRAQTLTKPLERLLSSCFGGDWLAFLQYLGEQPDPEEQIVTAMPEIQLNIGGKGKTAAVAAEEGVPIEEVERMLAAFWQQATPTSPIERRVALMRRYWANFDDIHAQQTSRMTPLWGLVDDSRFILLDDNRVKAYHPGLFRQLLPPEILVEIEDLWGAMMLPQWPDRMVSNPFPHVTMAETMGAALQFWHGCALTAWFICEGPSSRTDIAGLPKYFRESLDALKNSGTPVDNQLFRELRQAEKQLGPEQPITSHSETIHGPGGVNLTMTIASGVRRDGFEKLRDIITGHRRAWIEQHLDHYLRSRWESEVREAGRVFNQVLHNKGKLPTLKQWVKSAEVSTNHWFGGDVSGLYAAIGEKIPVQTQRHTLLPKDVISFVRSVHTLLGGHVFTPEQRSQASETEQERQRQIERLARLSLWYVQVEEALGRPPEIKEFGASKLEGLATTLHADLEEAWRLYRQALEPARQERGMESVRKTGASVPHAPLVNP